MFGLGAVSTIVALCFAVVVNTMPSSDATIGSVGLAAQAFPPIPDFSAASWIWTSTNGLTGVPPGASAFRLTVPVDTAFNTFGPSANISVAISADDAYNLYLNGKLFGSRRDFLQSNIWTINNVPTTQPWVFAILATNYAGALNSPTANPAGIIASFVASSSSTQKAEFWSTGPAPNPQWKGANLAPNHFYSTTMDDSDWPAAVVLTPFGDAPWGRPVPVPASLCV
ncbi:hypothetical protein R3P38DRAFT_1114761 [Favolaschia claudopus]|uniref:Uncharacterized protein n=1 Tax=Favolaschia claudopus TaxID=2862362 RepID=A0AAW0B9D4_9AGAR